MEKIILSMTTIPSRKSRLEENIESLLNQTYKFDKLVINIDDNFSQEDINWYKKFAKKDNRIEIGFGETKWRSCNKLLPTLKKYHEDIIITIDDDIYYPNETIERLINKHNSFNNCIIAHEVNPIYVDKEHKTVIYLNDFDIMLEQISYCKYLSNCALFPPHSFDNTDLYNYEKMIYCTQGNHDELWFWINSTLNKTKVIGLDYVYSFGPETKNPYKDNEYQLTKLNENPQTIYNYNKLLNEVYGKQIYDIVTAEPVVFFVTTQNSQLFIALMPQIVRLYNYGIKLKFDKNVTSWYRNIIKDFFTKNY